MKFAASLLLAVAVIAAAAYAAPILGGGMPENNTFIGKGSRNFSINATSADLNASSVLLFIISGNAYEQQENWDNYTLSCSPAAGSTWSCIRSISFSIAGTDTVEYFYFEARDNSGETGNFGNSTSFLKFTIDRNPPQISFAKPQNGSYVPENFPVQIDTSDNSSGVNASTLQFSTDNTTWINMTNGTGSYNASAFANNQTITLYARVTDRVNNSNSTAINVTVDKELPQISGVVPANNSVLKGTVALRINATDGFSGINASRVSYAFMGQTASMSCSGPGTYTCTAGLDTAPHGDANTSITFTAEDNAGNQRNYTSYVAFKNSEPAITITNQDGLAARGAVAINATIARPEGIITSVKLNITKGSQTTSANMSCNTGFTACQYLLDTSQFPDGAYSLAANANNLLGYDVTNSITMKFDNTKPAVAISAPSTVKKTFTLGATITDDNPDNRQVTFSAGTVSRSMPCSLAGKTLTCSVDYDSSVLADGPMQFGITATDALGNSQAASKTINIDNGPPAFGFLKVDPAQLENYGTVQFTAGLDDAGSSVTGAKAIVRQNVFSAGFNLSQTNGFNLSMNGNVWSGSAIMNVLGNFNIDVEATDGSGNTALFRDRGFFHVGPISCGDGVCQPGENYCICSSDCSGISCQPGQALECGSGTPVCSKPAACGDSVCSASETCSTCSADCGECAAQSPVSISSSGVVLPGGASASSGGQGEAFQLPGDTPSIALYAIAGVAAALIASLVIRRLRKPKEENHLWS